MLRAFLEFMSNIRGTMLVKQFIHTLECEILWPSSTRVDRVCLHGLDVSTYVSDECKR